jgi:hypothetical protein
MKKILAAMLAFSMTLSLFTTGAFAESATGTRESPLQIGTKTELLEFASSVESGNTDLCAVLTSNIVVDDWNTIGKTEEKSANYNATTGPINDSLYSYIGTFDGNGYKLQLSKEADTTKTTFAQGSGVALFHTIGTGGVVKNLNIDVNFAGYTCLAGVAVKNYGTIEYVTVTGSLTGSNYIGGIASWNGTRTIGDEVVSGRILYCVNKAKISGYTNIASGGLSGKVGGVSAAGGICGSFFGEMRYCVNLGEIWFNSAATNNGSGGLFNLRASLQADEPVQKLIVLDCYNAGTMYSVGVTPSVWNGGLISGGMARITHWEDVGALKISNVFNFGNIINPYLDLSPNNKWETFTIIGGTSSADFLDLHVEAIFSNIYYNPAIGGRVFTIAALNGADDYGTNHVKNVIHSKTTDEFATAALAAALNNGRVAADAPWEYVEGADYPTLKFERADYDPTLDLPPPITYDHITAAAGYGGAIALDGSILTITANDGYLIDIIYIDGVAATAEQAVPSGGDAVHGAAGAAIDLSNGFDDVKSIVATFAYTLNFNTPANGTLSVSRGAQPLTSGSIVRAGETLTITATPDSGYNASGTVFGGLTQVGSTENYTVTAARATPPSITAKFAANPPVLIDPAPGTKTDTPQTSDDVPVGGGVPHAPAPETPPAVVATETVEIKATVDAATGKAASEVTAESAAAAIADAAKAVADAKTSGDANAIAEVKIIAKAETAETVKSAEVNIPAEAVKAVAEAKDLILTIESDVSTVTLDAATLTAIAETAKDGETIKIATEAVDNAEALNDKQREKVGDNPVIEVNISVGETAITNLGGTVTVSVPYTPPATVAETDQDLLTVYHLDDDGNITEMKGARYDAATGKITFATTHFSKFLISEWINPFEDIAKGEWFYKAARYAYSNTLITGTTDTTFAPQATLTRAMLATILYRNAVGGGVPDAPPSSETPFTDVAPGQWYTPAIAWASSNNLITGVGDNKFAPNDSITREQFATLLYRYTQWSDAGNGTSRTPSPTDANLSAYTDAETISDWAQEAMAWAYANGLVTGRTPTTLAPKIPANRAEAAMLLQRYLETIT